MYDRNLSVGYKQLKRTSIRNFYSSKGQIFSSYCYYI